MKISATPLLLPTLLLGLLASHTNAQRSELLIAGGSDAYFGLGEEEFTIKQVWDFCRFKLQKPDGNLVVERQWELPYEPFQRRGRRVAWSSGGDPNPSDDYGYYLTFGDDSSLIVKKKRNNADPREGDEVIWKNRPRFEARGDYFQLFMDEDCSLRVRDAASGTYTWDSSQRVPLGFGDIMEQGEQIHGFLCHKACEVPNVDCIYVQHFMHLQQDCNLVQYIGQDRADIPLGIFQTAKAVWSTGTHTHDGDCFLQIDEDKPRLYAGTVDNPGKILWETDEDNSVVDSYPCYEAGLDPSGGFHFGAC